MTIDYPWANPANYAYLKSLKVGLEKDKAFAWEFIRRNSDYRATYNSLQPIRDKLGKDWRRLQPREFILPPPPEKMPVGQWIEWCTHTLITTRKGTKSQQLAEAWYLHDFYDPAQPYDKDQIRFLFRESPTMIYATESGGVVKNTLEDLQTDILHLDNAGSIFVRFDLRVGFKEQQIVISKAFAERAGKPVNRGREPNFITYLQFLDALNANPELPDSKIIAAIGIPKHHSVKKASSKGNDFRTNALQMSETGYKNLLYHVMIRA